MTNEIIKEQLQKFDEKNLENVIEKKLKELEGSLKSLIQANQGERISYSEALKETTQKEISTLIRVAQSKKRKKRRIMISDKGM